MPIVLPSRAARRGAALACAGALLTGTVDARSEDRSQTVAACMDAYIRGQQYRKDNDLLQARATFAKCADAACPALVRGDCTTWLGQVVESIPTIVLDARLGTDSILDVTVSMDGEVVARQLDGKPMTVNPGLHTFVFTRAGAPPVEKKVIVVESARGQVVAATWAASGAGGGEAPPIRETADGGVPVPTYVLGGTAVVALGAFAYLGLSGNSTERRLESTCSPHCSSGDVSALKTQFIAADVAAGLSALAAAGAIAVFLTRPSRDVRGLFRAEIKPVAGGAAVVFAGSF